MFLFAIISVLAVSSVAAVLAAILVLSEKYILNYGPCKIDINAEKEFTITGGTDLLSVLRQQQIFIPSACGGRGTCAYCKCKILAGAGPFSPSETALLEDEEKKESIRLSCQVKVREDLKIQIPEYLLAVKEYQCTCTDIKDLTYDIKQFTFQMKEPSQIDYTPGQYVQLLAPVYKKSSEEVYRAYSISSDPKEKDKIETIIRLVPDGVCTTYCFEYLKVGDTVKLNGPYGNFCLSDSDAPMIFAAGGSGMAPIKCLLHQMVNTNCTRKAIYFFGARSTKDLFCVDEMKEFEERLQNFTFVPVVGTVENSEKWTGKRGLVTEEIERSFESAEGYEAYLCGSPGMIDSAVKVLKKLGVSEEKIFYDKFE